MSRPNTPPAGSASGSHGLPAGAWSTRHHTTPHTRPPPPPHTQAQGGRARRGAATSMHATSMHAPPTCPARATHTGTAASPSRVCHHGVRGRSTVRQALGPDNRDLPSPVVSAQRRVLTVGQGVRHRP